MSRRAATPEQREAAVAMCVKLMGEGLPLYRAADSAGDAHGWSRNAIINWVREDQPEAVEILRGANVPAHVRRLKAEVAMLRAELRRQSE